MALGLICEYCGLSQPIPAVKGWLQVVLVNTAPPVPPGPFGQTLMSEEARIDEQARQAHPLCNPRQFCGPTCLVGYIAGGMVSLAAQIGAAR